MAGAWGSHFKSHQGCGISSLAGVCVWGGGSEDVVGLRLVSDGAWPMGARSRSYLLKGLVLTRSQAVLEGCWGLPLPGWLAKARDPRAVSMYGFYLCVTSVVCRERTQGPRRGAAGTGR